MVTTTITDLPPITLKDPKELLLEWKKQIAARDHGVCCNCEKASQTGICFIVPPEVGGRFRLENGVTICRTCRLLAESERVLPMQINKKTPINFLLSRKLHDSVKAFAESSNFGNISALIRHMILSFIQMPNLFEDISLYQDYGPDPAGIKINGWVDGDSYSKFQMLCKERGLSYSDAFKALLIIAMDTKVTKETV